MSNQWGRNNQTARSSGSSGLLLPAVLCVALAGAGGYFWFSGQQMQTQIAALNERASALSGQLAQVTAEKDKANSTLIEFKKNSGNWAEELEKEYADLKLNQVPKLNRLLDKRDAEIASLEKLVTTEKTAAKSAADDFTATIARINGELTALKTDAANARAQANGLDAEKLGLNKQIASLKADLERANSDTVAARKALEQKVTEAEKKPATFKSALDLARDVQIGTLEKSLADERRKVEALETQLKDQAEAAAKAPVATPSNIPVTDGASDVDKPAADTARAPRDRLMVDNIVGTTRGVGFLDDEKKQRLKDQLVSGACVTDALESVFDKVPLILMRNLMRDFKSDC